MGRFKQLKVWQHAQAVAVLSKAANARLPAEEADALADQWRRASYSFRAEELAKLDAMRDECATTVYGLLRKFSGASPAPAPSRPGTSGNLASGN
jgi:hypothetical protein